MFVVNLSVDDWDGPHNSEREVSTPTTEEIREAIEQLDAERHSLVTLHANGDVTIAVGGGDGRFVVFATFDNQLFYNLLGPGDPAKLVEVFVGGQIGEYPENTVVDRSSALSAAMTFAQTGELDSRFSWAEQ